MKHYAGIDVSLNSSTVCVVDESGKIVRETKVASEPVAVSPTGKEHKPNLCRLCSRRRSARPYRGSPSIVAAWISASAGSPSRRATPTGQVANKDKAAGPTIQDRGSTSIDTARRPSAHSARSHAPLRPVPIRSPAPPTRSR